MEIRHIDEVGLSEESLIAAPLFSHQGMTNIEIVNLSKDKNEIIPALIIYGRCAAGDRCAENHAVFFELPTFDRLTNKYFEELNPITSKAIKHVKELFGDTEDPLDNL